MTIQPDQLPSSRLDGKRLWRRLGELALIGATAAGGVDRPSLSAPEASARRQLIAWAAELGFAAATDPIGNLFFRLEGSEPGLPPVLTGSYLDTQPAGGRFSGAYGMLAALEALAAIGALGARCRRPVVAVCWTNGECARFVPGFMGSEAFAGRRPLAEILAVEDAAGIRVGDELAAILNAQGALPQLPLGFECAAYLETHLEQGAVLEQHHRQIGVVSGVRGIRRFEVRVTGEAGHVGTTPKPMLRDALQTAVRIISALNQFFAAPDISFGVGHLRVEPNAPAVVPRETVFSVDIRHHDNMVLTRLGDTVKLICESEKGTCRFTVTELMSHPTIAFPVEITDCIERATDRLGYTHMPVVSLGGHDAMVMHWKCPSGIVFIPCKDGVSHNEAEEISEAAAVAGGRVLADAVWALAG